MDRKEFIKEACWLGIACGGSMLFADPKAAAQPAEAKQDSSASERGRKLREAWIVTLMENMEKTLDEATRRNLMGQCGRACARRGPLYETAKLYRGDAAKFVETVGSRIGRDLCNIKDNVIHWGYPRCYCELVAEGPARLPDSYCFCSVGWVEEMFETVLGKPVKVELLQSVKRGAPDCRFTIRI
jgi:hypothetical protein